MLKRKRNFFRKHPQLIAINQIMHSPSLRPLAVIIVVFLDGGGSNGGGGVAIRASLYLPLCPSPSPSTSFRDAVAGSLN